MQLVAYGAQDIYLTGNPQITFFKVVYRRHTNFAVESIEQTYNGSVGASKKISVTVSRNGDLLHRVYLRCTTSAAVTDAFDALDYVECEIGGQVIDKHYGEWMQLWVDLTLGGDTQSMLKKMRSAAAAGEVCYVPLQFWFCRNAGLALPLIALQYHEVKLNIQFAAAMGGVSDVGVWCDYVFLDTDERRRFAQVSHEYLIEQVQFSNALSAGTGTGAVLNKQMELRFNHPVKELQWLLKNSTDGAYEAVTDALLQLNGHDRFKRREGKYFTTVQRYQSHSGAGDDANHGLANKTHVYSFALKPEEHQPSGTCNFSRIDNAVLNVNFVGTDTKSYEMRVYAVNYNVLRIMSGMGGLAYSN
jgi:hypothetical protein